MNAAIDKLSRKLTLEQSPWQCALGQSEFPQAAVLVALTDDPEPGVVLGRRAKHLAYHPGEVAFAGGKREPEDRSPWSTALREAREEVCIPAERVVPIAEIDPLVTRTRFEVFPCIGVVPASLELVVDPAEFDSVFVPRLQQFADATAFELKEMFDGDHYRKVPSFRVGEDTVWGVTAAILAKLANVAYDAGFDLQRDWKRKP